MFIVPVAPKLVEQYVICNQSFWNADLSCIQSI